MELVSIIVPVYNVRRFLERCIESLVNQTYCNIEILLVDDGSTDGSGEICDQMQKIYPDKIKVIHKSNGGLSDARNVGIANATGEYLCFVDSDDFVAVEMLQVLVSDMKRYDVALSCVGFQVFSDGDIPEKHCTDEDVCIFDCFGAMKELFSTNTFCNFAWNKLYKKELFRDVYFPVGRKMEDLGTTYKIIEKCNRVSYNSRKLYYYYQRPDSILHTPDTKFYIDKFELSMERYLYLKKQYGDFQENIADVLFTIFQCYYYIMDDLRLREIAERELAYLWKQHNAMFSMRRKIKYVVLRINRKWFADLFGKRLS